MEAKPFQSEMACLERKQTCVILRETAPQRGLTMLPICGSRFSGGMFLPKHQPPSTKETSISNHPIRFMRVVVSGCRVGLDDQLRLRRSLELDVWRFSGAWMLALEALPHRLKLHRNNETQSRVSSVAQLPLPDLRVAVLPTRRCPTRAPDLALDRL